MKIGIITTSRADYGIYLPLIQEIQYQAALDLTIFALGMHLEKRFGYTIQQIQSDRLKVVSCAPSIGLDSPIGIAMAMGKTTQSLAEELKKHKVDLLFCLGDRYEMLSAALAAVPFNIPLAHIHGGETTAGAVDDKFRHALTKLSDYHFASCEAHKTKIVNMGTDPLRVFNVGALGIDHIKRSKLLTKTELSKELSIDFDKPTILATYHPVTTELGKNQFYAQEFAKALKRSPFQAIITQSNADTEGSFFRNEMNMLSNQIPDRFFIFESLGSIRYFSVMKHSQMVVGNSSSGIIEAASFSKPVVNIGNRQAGRICSNNVIHTREDENSILAGIQEAQKMIGKTFVNVYEVASSAKLIVEIIRNLTPSCS